MGNITTGTELVRRRMNVGEASVCYDLSVDYKSGSKFGKSEGGNIWLTADKTSVYKFYQFWLNNRCRCREIYQDFYFLEKKKY
jgi:tyrosyl-tRNA synthetase